MGAQVFLEGGTRVVGQMVEAIQANKAYLSEIDGAIGDGDHGINMSKGFGLALERVRTRGEVVSLPQALEDLALTLLEGIGGSMGPLYGGFFLAMSESLEQSGDLDAPSLLAALEAGTAAVQEVGGARLGDKTLIDTLTPALADYRSALERGETFEACLGQLVSGARRGWESTREMRARLGRASRLGERSKGVLDAGATSCYLLLESMAGALRAQLEVRAG